MSQATRDVGERAFLRGRAVGISVSGSPDLAVLGLGDLHLRDAATEIARHILVAGGELVYGGDLRQDGFTLLLLELIARHWRPGPTGDGEARPPLLTNYLPWPVHVAMEAEDIKAQTSGFAEAARVVLLDKKGNEVGFDPQRRKRDALPGDWKPGLTAMRRHATARIWARIALGGPVGAFRGKMPGIAEEVLLALEARHPVYLLGGFGGCARDIAESLGLAPASPARPVAATRTWAGRGSLKAFSIESLQNGLLPLENARLAVTAHVDEAVALVLRGMRRVAAESAPAGAASA